MMGKMNVGFGVTQTHFVSSWMRILTSLCLSFCISKIVTLKGGCRIKHYMMDILKGPCTESATQQALSIIIRLDHT